MSEEGGIKLDYEVAGKRVTMRRRLRNAEAHLLPQIMSDYKGDYNDFVRMAMICVESWEFDGDPRRPKSYEDMDIFDELRPLGEAVVEYINARNEAARNVPN